MTDEELQEMINTAVEAKVNKAVEKVTAETKAAAEDAASQIKAAQLSNATNTGETLHMDPGTGYEFAIIAVNLIDWNPLSNRTPEELDPKNPDLQPLMEDIKSRGGLQRPPLVYRKDGRYVLVKGARRLAALRGMGEETTYAFILPAKPPIGMEEQWVNGY